MVVNKSQFNFVCLIAILTLSFVTVKAEEPSIEAVSEIPPRIDEQKRQGIPKWDVGLAFGLFDTPDYPGSDESHNRFLALPYFYYRGEIIRNDRDGLRGKLFNSKRVEMSLSAGAAFPSKSSDNEARKNMPDINWTGQLGPQIEIHLNQNPIAKVDLMIPYRFVFSTDFKRLDSRGAVFNPELKLRHRALFDPKMSFGFSLGATWATESLNDYFYDVPTSYATADRNAYNAKAGLLGYESSFVLSRLMTKHLFLYSGVQKRFYADSKNRSSPLMRDIETELYFVGLAWSIFRSGEGYVDNKSGGL